MDSSGKGGTPLPCLETFHGDKAFSEQVQWKLYDSGLISSFLYISSGEPGGEKFCFE